MTIELLFNIANLSQMENIYFIDEKVPIMIPKKV
jgi:hypothetical protein